MRAGPLSTSLLFLVACGSGAVHLAPPDLDALTLVLAHRPDPATDWTVAVYAPTQVWTAEVSSADAVYLLGYAETVGELGLEGNGRPDCRLRHPDRIAKLVELEGNWTWAALDGAPTEVLDAVIGDPRRCNACAVPQMRSVVATHTYRYRGVAWLEDGSLLGVHENGYARITLDAIEVLPGCGLASLRPIAIAALGDDRFLIGGADGELIQARFSDGARTCVVETSTQTPVGELTPVQAGFDAIAVNPEDPGAFDYYALRNTGELYRWTAEGLRLVGVQRLHPEATEAMPASLLRLDAARLLTSVGSKEVVFWENDQVVKTDVLDLPTAGVSNTPRDRVTALYVDPRLPRYLAGTATGEVWARDVAGGSWTKEFQSPVLEAVGAIFALSDRYVILQDGGDAASWAFDGGVCGDSFRIPMASGGSSCKLVARRGELVALADAMGSSNSLAGVVWVEP